MALVAVHARWKAIMYNEIVKQHPRRSPGCLIPCRNDQRIPCKVIGNEQDIFDTTFGRFKGQVVYAHDFHRGRRLNGYQPHPLTNVGLTPDESVA